MFKEILNNRIVKAGSWYTFTNFFTVGISFLTLPIFTRILSTSDYGITSVYSSYISIFSVVFSLDLVAAVQRAKFDFRDEYDNFISSVLFLAMLSFIFFSTVLAVFNGFFSKTLGLEKWLLFFAPIHSFFSFVQNFVFAKFSIEYKYRKISIVQITNSVVGVLLSILLILLVFNNKRYFGRIIGSALPVVVSGFALLIYVFRKGKKFIEPVYWKYALVISVPLIFHTLAGIINSQFDRIFINKYIGTSEAGIYSFAYNIGLIINVLWTSTNQAWVPWFFEKMDASDYAAIQKRARNFRDLFTVAYVVILFLSPEIIRIMADKRYWIGLSIVPYIFMAYYLNLMYSFEVNVEFYAKKTHLIPIGTILSAAVNVILNIIFIPRYGYVAAAITTVISNFFLFFFHFLITNYLIKTKIFGMKFHFVSLVYVIASTAAFILLQNYSLARVGILILGAIYLYRKYKVVFKEK